MITALVDNKKKKYYFRIKVREIRLGNRYRQIQLSSFIVTLLTEHA